MREATMNISHRSAARVRDPHECFHHPFFSFFFLSEIEHLTRRLFRYEIVCSNEKSLCGIVFQFQGSIWCSVLPYCLLNCAIMGAVEILAMNHVKIAFSSSGHTLMTLIISYLVVAKINLSYDRYMKARHAIGHALSSLRELNQMTMQCTQPNPVDNSAKKWRREVSSLSTELCTVCMD